MVNGGVLCPGLDCLMPVHKSGGGYKYGSRGKTYRGKGARAKAARQGRAIQASKARACGQTALMAFIEQEGGGGGRVVIVRPGRHSYRVEVDTRPPGNLVLTERQRKLLSAAELRAFRDLPLSDQLRVQRELASALLRQPPPAGAAAAGGQPAGPTAGPTAGLPARPGDGVGRSVRGPVRQPDGGHRADGCAPARPTPTPAALASADRLAPWPVTATAWTSPASTS